jgi:hypothetical protein
MSHAILFAGDQYHVTVTVLSGGDPIAIDPESTVTIGLANIKTSELIAGPWIASADTDGANWPSGTVVFTIESDDTANLLPQLSYIEMRIEVDGEVVTRISPKRIAVRTAALS